MSNRCVQRTDIRKSYKQTLVTSLIITYDVQTRYPVVDEQKVEPIVFVTLLLKKL